MHPMIDPTFYIYEPSHSLAKKLGNHFLSYEIWPLKKKNRQVDSNVS